MRRAVAHLWKLLTPTILAGALACACALPAVSVAAEGGEGAVWRLEQPSPPKAPPGTPELSLPIGLGQIGDIEFWEPNRGLLITHGNGKAIPPGVWAYDGVEWREIAEVCGASEGSIAWAGPDEFWTVSDGRPGQVSESSGTQFERQVPLEDNTLCHFAGGSVVGSYAHPAGEADSYQAMHAAACIPPLPPRWTPRTVGLGATRSRNRSSGPSTCTGMGAAWKPNHHPGKGTRWRA